jgi:hypothetical protein
MGGRSRGLSSRRRLQPGLGRKASRRTEHSTEDVRLLEQSALHWHSHRLSIAE